MESKEGEFHVLAVDDSIVERKLLEKRLKRSSYQVTAVESGREALKFLGLSRGDDRGARVNLIITDYSMPGMTGYELLKTIKESDSFRGIPVVIMSSEDEPSRIKRCLEDGAEQFFLKPVKSTDIDSLRSHLMI